MNTVSTQFVEMRQKPVRGSFGESLCRRDGSALVTVMLFTSIAALAVGSILLWTTSHNRNVVRENEFVRAQNIAEAAVEKAYVAIRARLNLNNQAPSQSDCNGYCTSQLPTTTDDASFGDYTFVDTSGVSNRMTIVYGGAATTAQVLFGLYAGLYSSTQTYLITARAYSWNRITQLTAGIEREVDILNIPIFQFAIFYDPDLEMEPSPPMTITGRVHCNHNIYIAPLSTLEYQSQVTAALNIFNYPMTNDTHQSNWLAPTYDSTLTTGAPTLTLPFITTATGLTARAIIEMPPSGTDPLVSSTATNRLYTSAGLRIIVSNTVISVTDQSGAVVSMPSNIITTNTTLFNARENITNSLVNIDIGLLMSSNKVPVNGIVYVANLRTNKFQQAVRITNGHNVPTAGLSVVTPNPLYVQGNYNSDNDYPCALFADAINILSSSWSDANSAKAISSRVASSTTVNAAFYSGIVPTVTGKYSGGVENFPRFLEDWSNKTLTYCGSMVVMFNSQIATGAWPNASYNPPTRAWSFDTQFLSPSTVPPGCPSIIVLTRMTWAAVQ